MECSVCLTLMTYPVKLPCGHRICKTCATKIVADGRCPLDRRPIPPDFEITIDTSYKKEIKKTHPKEYGKRQHEMEEEQGINVEFEVSHKMKFPESGLAKKKTDYLLKLRATDPLIELTQHLIIDKVLLEVESETKFGLQIIRPEQHKIIGFLDHGCKGPLDIPITINFTRDTGRHDKAHKLTYHLDNEHDGQKRFKLKLHPMKLDKLTKLAAPPEKGPKKPVNIQQMQLLAEYSKDPRLRKQL